MTNTKNDPAVDVVFVTFPRSGHHLLERGLRAALGSRCCYQGQVDHRFDYPSQWWMKVGKTHDYDHSFRPKGQKVIVQSRNFKPAWESWVRYEEERRQKPPHKDVWLGYYQTFMNRWVHQKDQKDGIFYDCPVFHVPYVNLCLMPAKTLFKVLAFLDVPKEHINMRAVQSWVETVRLPKEVGEATTVEEDVNRTAEELPKGRVLTAEVSMEAKSDWPTRDDAPEAVDPTPEEPTKPSEPHQPSCDPSPVQKVRGLGMGTTDEL